MENELKNGKNPIYRKWWFWVIVILLVLICIGSTGDNTTTLSNANENVTESINEEDKKIEEDSMYKKSYQWECTGDVKHEGVKETEILAVEADEYNGTNLESGNYKISYSYNDYTSTFGLTTTNKYNRFYFVYIANELTNIDELLNGKIKINHEYTFSPALYDEQTIQLEKGQYIYIQHTAQKEAGYGTLKIEKIKE